MNKLIYKVAFISFFILSFFNVFSQTKMSTIKQVSKVLIKMRNGDEFKGQIIKKDNEILVVKTENGILNLITSNVRSIENYGYKSKFKFANPNSMRYFFGPSAIPIKKGKGYYQNVLLTSNFANYGITKNISIGGGFEFISTVLGAPVWFLTPKVGFDISENTHVGGGFIMAGFATQRIATLGYGVFTLGNSEKNLSIGAGYGLSFDALPVLNLLTIMISGTYRVSNSIALLSENYMFLSGFSDVSYFGIHGIRILSKKNSFDIGAIVIPVIAESIPALPYVGYVRVF